MCGSYNYHNFLDSISVFKWKLLRWAQQKELVSVSGPDVGLR
jgi:hypothetical protein